MNRLLHISLVVLCCFAIAKAKGQDHVLSQYWQNPMLLNAGQTGHMEADYRGAAHYRSQWGSITDAFTTTAATGEYALFRSTRKPSYLGVGIQIFQDQAGKGQLKRFQGEASASYQLQTNNYNHIGAGMSIGYFQRSITFDGLLWDSQYNGAGVDPSIESGEDFSNDSRGFVDAGIGIVWEHDKNLHYEFGLAWRHFFQGQSLLNTNEDAWLPMQVFTYSHYSNYKLFLVDYHFLLTRQGGSTQYTGTALLKYRFGSDSRYTTAKTSNQILVGVTYRYQDAIIPIIGYEYERKLTFTFSYDLNISGLQEVSNLQGGMEVGLVYNGFLVKKRRRI